MKNKIALFLTIIIGFMPLTQAHAQCSLTLSYENYRELKAGGTVNDYYLIYENFGRRGIHPGDTLYYNPKRDRKHCGYNLWSAPDTGSQLMLQYKGGLSKKMKGK